MTSVLVIGGGVIGCACALALVKRGARVTVLERNAARTELPGETGVSTWAAAGIVSVGVATHGDGPLSRLCVEGRARYATFAADLRERTGRDVELRDAGVLRPAFDEGELASICAECAWQTPAGLRVEHLDAAAARALEPALSEDVVGALRFPDDPRVDPPALLAALREALVRAGVTLRLGAEVRRVQVRDGRAHGVALADGSVIESDAVLVAAGSWSSLVEGSTLPAQAIEPARGQAIELKLDRQILRGVIEGSTAYLSPRDDGRVVVGSTVEHTGYRLGATARVVSELLAGAIQLVPALADATVARTWAGLRPYHPGDELPLLGKTGIEGLLVATGHFRNGVLLAPITADIITAILVGEPPPFDVTPFSPLRLAS